MLRRRVLDLYSAPPSDDAVGADGFVFQELLEDAFASAPFCRPRLELFRRHLNQGFVAHGFIADDGALAFYMWFCLGHQISWAPWALGARIAVPSESGYIFDCKTDEPHRNKGLYKAALKEGRRLYREAKCETVLIDVEPANAPAVRAIKAAGFQKQTRIEVAKLGPLYRTTQDKKSRYSLGRCSYILD